MFQVDTYNIWITPDNKRRIKGNMWIQETQRVISRDQLHGRFRLLEPVDSIHLVIECDDDVSSLRMSNEENFWRYYIRHRTGEISVQRLFPDCNSFSGVYK